MTHVTSDGVDTGDGPWLTLSMTRNTHGDALSDGIDIMEAEDLIVTAAIDTIQRTDRLEDMLDEDDGWGLWDAQVYEEDFDWDDDEDDL